MSYGFRRAVAADAPLIDGWLRLPHVAEWWGPEARFDPGKLADARQDVRIVTLAGREIGYMQDYDPHGWEGHPFAWLPPGARGVDQFIGPADMLGLGHGPRFIAQRLAALFAAGAPAIGTDPHPDNARAIAAYRKAGFAVAGPPADSPWGRYLPMVALRPGPAA
ncbi:MAG: GNAT family N-acetyltransferase [Maritimibacter sp.]|nr:GNAT family N-acetyltransferase [Maritimibacter sp.]